MSTFFPTTSPLWGCPPEVIGKMLDEQYRQYGYRRPGQFKAHTQGFTWSRTEAGGDFWCNVICEQNYDLFFEKYPHRHLYEDSKRLEYFSKMDELLYMLSELPKKYRDEAFHEFNPCWMYLCDITLNNVSDALNYAFSWGGSKQGAAYWRDVHAELLEKEREDIKVKDEFSDVTINPDDVDILNDNFIILCHTEKDVDDVIPILMSMGIAYADTVDVPFSRNRFEEVGRSDGFLFLVDKPGSGTNQLSGNRTAAVGNGSLITDHSGNYITFSGYKKIITAKYFKILYGKVNSKTVGVPEAGRRLKSKERGEQSRKTSSKTGGDRLSGNRICPRRSKARVRGVATKPRVIFGDISSQVSRN